MIADKRQPVANAARLRLATPGGAKRQRQRERFGRDPAQSKETLTIAHNAIVSLCWIYELVKTVANWRAQCLG